MRLAAQTAVQPGQIVSRTLAQNDAVSITLFAFAAGEEISTHSSDGDAMEAAAEAGDLSDGDAMVLVLEGSGRFTVDGKTYAVSAGEALVMPAGKPHAVNADSDFKMLLTVVFPR